MTVRPVRILGDPVLRQRAQNVDVGPEGFFAPHIDAITADMHDTLNASGGVVLAASQIGFALRIFAYNILFQQKPPQRHRGVIVNPVMDRDTAPSPARGADTGMEGCLSFPGVLFPTRRAAWARVNGLSAHGTPVTLEGTDVIARVIQHGMGHLDGILFVDHLAHTYRRQAFAVAKANGWGRRNISWMPGERATAPNLTG